MGRRGKPLKDQLLKAMRYTGRFDRLNDHIEITVTSQGLGPTCWK